MKEKKRMIEKEIFRTQLVNQSKREVVIFEAEGTPLITMGPASKYSLLTDDPKATFARFAEVVFFDRPPWAQCSIRPGWVEPKRKWPTEFILIDGKRSPEYRSLTDRPTLCLMRGVPVIVDLSLLDQYVTYSKIEVSVETRRRIKSSEVDGIVDFEWTWEDVKHTRSLDEVLAIQREIEEHVD
jgi:hypothetical protein